jgi:hypothetical protein
MKSRYWALVQREEEFVVSINNSSICGVEAKIVGEELYDCIY